MLGFLAEWLFPIECISCGKSGSWFCRECFENIEFYPLNSCIFCGCFSFLGLTCNKCRTEKKLDGVFSYNSYKKIVLKKLINNYKYNYVESLSQDLSLMVETVIENIKKGQAIGSLPLIIDEKTLYFFVPLHKKRLRQRGFNQSFKILEDLSGRGMVENSFLAGGLFRNRYTAPQAKIDDNKERSLNLKNAFSYQGDSLNGKNIVLIDDVATTGATLEECAKVLKAAGAKKVYGVCVARG